MYLMNCIQPDSAYAVGRLSQYTQSPNKEHWTAISRVLKYLRGTMDFGLKYSVFPAYLKGGYVFTIGGGAVSWKSSKQTCIALSTMESEFIALEKAGTEAEWLRNLLVDIPLWKRPAPSELNLADPLTKSLCRKLCTLDGFTYMSVEVGPLPMRVKKVNKMRLAKYIEAMSGLKGAITILQHCAYLVHLLVTFVNNLSDDPLLKTLGPNFRSYFYRAFHQFKRVFAEFKSSHHEFLFRAKIHEVPKLREEGSPKIPLQCARVIRYAITVT
ncbi:unnamed protein product [Prunus armeniaca]